MKGRPRRRPKRREAVPNAFTEEQKRLLANWLQDNEPERIAMHVEPLPEPKIPTPTKKMPPEERARRKALRAETRARQEAELMKEIRKLARAYKKGKKKK